MDVSQELARWQVAAKVGGRWLEGCRDELRYLQAMSFVCMESIVEVILIIVRYRVGRGGVNMDVLQGD
jgi:hypothetical protein